jgi:hypothetical protein
LSDDREYVALPEQHAAARRAVTGDLAGHQPSINCPYIDATQMSDLAFRQELLVIESIHDVTFPFALRPRASAMSKRPETVYGSLVHRPVDWRVRQVFRIVALFYVTLFGYVSSLMAYHS